MATIIVAISFFIAGCAPSVPSGSAKSALDQYHQALIAGKTAEARGMLSDYAKRHSVASSLEPSAKAAQITTPIYGAVLQTRNGALHFVHEEGQWLVNSPLPSFLDQSTPESALLTLERAIRLGDWQTAFTLIPPARRAGLSPTELAIRMNDEGLRKKTENALRLLARQGQKEQGQKEQGQESVVFRHGPHRAELIAQPEGDRTLWFVDDLQ